MAPPSFKPRNRWELLVNFTPWPAKPRESASVCLNRKSSVFERPRGCFEEKFRASAGNRTNITRNT